MDNVVRSGHVLALDSDDPTVADERVDATVIQTVGAKGHDGFVLPVVRA